MANSPYLTDQAVLGASPEIMGLERGRRLADLLTASGLKQPQGEMVSGHYVKPAFTQQINPLVNALVGTTMNKNLDEQQVQLAAALRSKQAKDVQKYALLQETDPAMALQFALSSDNPTLKSLAQDELKGYILPEGATRQRGNIATGKMETVGQGGAKYHPPISVDMGTMGTKLIYQDGRTEIIPKGVQGPAGQVVETANGPMLIDTRTGASKPIMGAGGQPLAPKLSTEQSKDITSINQQRSTIEGALQAVAANPTAFSFARGASQNLPYGESLAGKLDKPENAAARAYVYNNVSAVIKERAGQAVNAKEMQRIDSFMPAVTDNATQIKNKLDGFKTYLKDLETGTRMNPNVQMQPQGSVQVSPAGQTPRVVDFNSLPTGAR
jgi:hypothetical protein